MSNTAQTCDAKLCTCDYGQSQGTMLRVKAKKRFPEWDKSPADIQTEKDEQTLRAADLL